MAGWLCRAGGTEGRRPPAPLAESLGPGLWQQRPQWGGLIQQDSLLPILECPALRSWLTGLGWLLRKQRESHQEAPPVSRWLFPCVCVSSTASHKDAATGFGPTLIQDGLVSNLALSCIFKCPSPKWGHFIGSGPASWAGDRTSWSCGLQARETPCPLAWCCWACSWSV